MIRSDQKGAVLLVLIITMTLVSVLGAAVLSVSTNALYSELNTNSAAQAWYMAESGKRYAELYPLNTGDYYTFREQADGSFEQVDHSVTPVTDIADAGFRIRRTECFTESEGIVRENTPFETIRKLSVLKGGGLNGMPCWSFNQLIAVNEFEDHQGANTAFVKGSGTPLVADSAYGMALDTSTGNYVETDFNPYCEIGDAASFTISFQAKPAIGAPDGVVLGIDDLARRFAVEISGGKWRWAYGNLSDGSITAIENQWQHVMVIYDAVSESITMQVESCGADTITETTSVSGGSGTMPQVSAASSGLFIGAENVNGTSSSGFDGYIDEVSIYNSALSPENIPRYCEWQAPTSTYPFDGNADDTSGNGNNGTINDAIPVTGHIDMAYEFDGTGSYIHVPDSDTLDLTSAGTLAAWIYVYSFNPLAGIIHKGDTVSGSSFNESYTLQFGWTGNFGKTNRVVVGLVDKNGGESSLSSTTDLSTGIWYHVAATWDISEGILAIYVDGQKDAEKTISSTELKNISEGLNIGAQLLQGQDFNGKGNLPFDGIIDEVSIFDRALSPDEICHLYEDL